MSYTYRDGLARHAEGEDWHYRFKFRGKKYQGSTGLSRRGDALIWLRRYRDALANAEVGVYTLPTFQKAWEAWLEAREGKRSKSHLDRAKRAMAHVLPKIGQVRCDLISTEIVEELLSDYLAGGRTADGANVVLAYIKAVLGYLRKQGMLRKLPFEVAQLRVQQPVRAYLHKDQVEAFLAALDTRPKYCQEVHLHAKIAIRAMLYMGLREAEALGMRWEWFSDGLATYTPGATKGKEAVPLPVPEQVREWIEKARAKNLSPWVLPAEDGQPHRAQFTVKPIQRAAEALGIKGLSPHRLRTTCATLMAQAGVNALLIKRQLRHKDMKTTERYVQVGLEDQRDALKATWG